MQKQLISFLKLRAAIGILGIVFPLVLIVSAHIFGDCKTIRESLSAYYFTQSRDFFIGLLFVVGSLLITYKGYSRFDSILANISGFAAMGIAIFPTENSFGNDACNLWANYQFPTLHYICAGTFFISLIIFSIILFRKTNPNSVPTQEKLMRNRVYLVCGWIMTLALLLMVLNKLVTNEIEVWMGLDGYFTFVMEWIFLCAFGVSWITKGEYILNDN